MMGKRRCDAPSLSKKKNFSLHEERGELQYKSFQIFLFLYYGSSFIGSTFVEINFVKILFSNTLQEPSSSNPP